MNKWLKLFLLAVLCLGSAKITFAQGALYQGIAWRYTPAGAFPAGGATVTICTSGASGAPCSPTITIYSDSALSTVASNPLAACTTAGQVGCIDNLGNFSFYMTPGTFSYTITRAGLSAYGPIPGGTSCVVGISCISPSGNIAFTGDNTHSGTEKFTNTVTAGNINAVRYVDGTQFTTIQAAVNSLPTISSKPAGDVYVTAPLTIATGQEVTIGPYTRLHFGPNATITYTGTGTAITCDDVPTSYVGDGGIYGLNITVTNNSATAIDVRECTRFEIHQAAITGPGASSTGYPILFENTQKWTEQSDLENVYALNFPTGITFQDNCAGHTGCPSFAYARWRHVVVSPVGSGGKGFSLENDANVNGSDLELQCFGNATAAISCLNLSGTASIDRIRMKLGGEGDAGPSNTGIATAVGTNFSPIFLWESWNNGTWSNSILGTTIPYIYKAEGYGTLYGSASGMRVGNTSNIYDVTLDSTGLTNFRTLTAPDYSGTISVIPTLTLKKGSGGGNYTNATTSYAVADSTNLCYTVTIPTGWKLGISASGYLSTATAAVPAQAALTDNAACSTANAGILVETAPIQGAGIGVADGFALNWIITGNGATHNIALQFKTSNAADAASLINSSATVTPTIKFELMPSN